MKKLIALLLVAITLFLFGCQSKEKDENPLKIAKDGTVTAQVNGETVVFQPWKEDTLPTEGDYYLTKDLVVTQITELTGDLRLCTRGHSVTVAAGKRFRYFMTVPKDMKLTLFDMGDNPGGFVAGRSYNAAVCTTSCINVLGELVMEGSKIDATAIEVEGVASGLCVYLRDDAKMTMNSGLLIGGTGWNSNDYTPEAENYMGEGGCVYVGKGAQCLVTGGTITGGSAARGGNFYVAGDGQKNGKLTVTGGEIVGGEALFSGGNIFVQGEVELKDITLASGQSYGNGGNLYVEGKLQVTNCEILDGLCDVNGKQGRKGGNLSVNGIMAEVYIKDSKLLRGKGQTREDYGGNIGLWGMYAKSFVIENTDIFGGVGHRGGNIYIGHANKLVPDENMKAELKNVRMGEGTTTYKGANICIDSDLKDRFFELNITDCEIMMPEGASTDNLSVGAGADETTYTKVLVKGGKMLNGGLCIYSKSTVTFDGAEINFAGSGSGGEMIVVNPS